MVGMQARLTNCTFLLIDQRWDNMLTLEDRTIYKWIVPWAQGKLSGEKAPFGTVVPVMLGILRMSWPRPRPRTSAMDKASRRSRRGGWHLLEHLHVKRTSQRAQRLCMGSGSGPIGLYTWRGTGPSGLYTRRGSSPTHPPGRPSNAVIGLSANVASAPAAPPRPARNPVLPASPARRHSLASNATAAKALGIHPAHDACPLYACSAQEIIIVRSASMQASTIHRLCTIAVPARKPAMAYAPGFALPGLPVFPGCPGPLGRQHSQCPP